MIQTPTRFAEQGFVNLHRKTLFRILAVTIIAYLYFVPDRWRLADAIAQSADIIGILLIIAGILGRTFATLSIGGHKDRGIMQTELYSVCRNPLYFASFLMAVGVGLLSERPDFLLLLVAGYLAIFFPMMLNEAKYLRCRFPEFADYEKRVPLFFPNFALWQQRQRFEIHFGLVKRTLLDASLALLVIPAFAIFRSYGGL